MEDVSLFEERRGGDTSVGTTEGVNGGPPIKNKLQMSNGEDASVCISTSCRILKNFPACLRPALIGGSILLIWCLVAAYVVLFHTQSAASKNTPSAISACSPVSYTGEVCRAHLEILQSCLSDRSTSSEIYVGSTEPSNELEQQAEQLLLGLQFLNPIPECREAVEPFLCLYVFGLCDSSGELYLPSSGECETLTTETCASEWTMAVSLLGSDQLPQCDSLPDTSLACNGSNTSADTDSSPDQNGTVSSQQMNITCADQFYLDEEVGLCLPECHGFSLYSDSGTLAASVIILGASIVGIIAAIVVLTLSCVNYKKVFSFPSGIIRYQTATMLLYNTTILLGCADHEFFYCSSRSLMENLITPSPFCTFTGIILVYTFWQLVIWWLCHVAVMYWGLRFPFQAHNFEVTGKTKYLHIIVFLLGLILPITPVAVALGTGGFILTRFPPIACGGRHSDINFYSLTLPISFMLAVGLTLLILLFWIIYKENKAMRVQGRAPEVKVLIIIIYFGTATAFAMVASTSTFWTGSITHLQEAFTSYVFCEANGIQSNSTCDRTELDNIIPIQALFDCVYVIFVIFPVVNLLYAVNVNDIKALKKWCMKCYPGWHKKFTTGKKESVATSSIPLSSM